MSSDPQQKNPTAQSQQPPVQTGSTDGVDISELAQRVASLSAELERITHESEPHLQQTLDTSTSKVTENKDAQQETLPTASHQPHVAGPIPAQTPVVENQDKVVLNTDSPKESESSLLQTNTSAPSAPTQQSASREGVNLSSLKQRVLESSTFGSRVQPAKEEPFDPLDLTERPRNATPTKPTTNVPQASLETAAVTKAPQQRSDSPHNGVPPSRITADPSQQPTEILPPTANTELPTDQSSFKGPDSSPAQAGNTLSQPVAGTPTQVANQPSPAARPTGPAHEFFDTIEWHARNDEAQRSIQTPPTAESVAASVAPSVAPPTAQPPLDEHGPVAETNTSAEPAPSALQQSIPEKGSQKPVSPQPATQVEPPQPEAASTESIPTAPIPHDDFASLTGSDHSGVEFVAQQSDDQEPLAKENADARDALDSQRRSIEGGAQTRESIAQTPASPIVPTSKPLAAPATPQPIEKVSPLTGRTVEPKGGEPVPTTLKPIRTFQDDIAQRVQTRDTSIVSVASAEQDRQNEELKQKEREQRKKKQRGGGEPAGLGTYLKIGLSGLFIGVSIAGLAFFGYLFLQPQDTVVVDTLPEYIFSDEQTRVDVTGQSRREFMNTLLAEKEKVSLRLGAISYLYLTLTTRLPEGGERINLLSSTEFFERIEAEVSGSLTRSLEPMMMFGVHVFDRNPPFLIFKVNFFENAFAGMLQWETEMQVDLAPLFGPALLIQQAPTEVVAPESIQPSSPNLGQFTDEIVRNKEVRVLRDSTDKIVLLYGFVDRNTLVITTNEFTFAEIVTRLSSRRF